MFRLPVVFIILCTFISCHTFDRSRSDPDKVVQAKTWRRYLVILDNPVTEIHVLGINFVDESFRRNLDLTSEISHWTGDFLQAQSVYLKEFQGLSEIENLLATHAALDQVLYTRVLRRNGLMADLPFEYSIGNIGDILQKFECDALIILRYESRHLENAAEFLNFYSSVGTSLTGKSRIFPRKRGMYLSLTTISPNGKIIYYSAKYDIWHDYKNYSRMILNLQSLFQDFGAYLH